MADLARHYGMAGATMIRLLRQEGIVAMRYVPPRKEPEQRVIRPARYRKATIAQKRSYTAVNHRTRDVSTEGEAADFLRRETRAVIYRCNERGAVEDKAAANGCWRFGNVVLTSAELLERARRKGFDPDAWRRVPGPHHQSQRQGMPQQQGAR